MPHAAVRILHPEPTAGAGELTELVARARSIAAEELARRFEAAGADDVRIDRGADDGLTFGARLRALAGELEPQSGVIVLGSGSIPLATEADIGNLLEVAASGERRAIANNRWSSDVVAVGEAAVLAAVPDLRVDNALPRWLETDAGVPVDELPDRSRLALDIDSPLDLELLGRHGGCPPGIRKLGTSMAHHFVKVREVFDELGAIARDPRWELLVAGRLSAEMLGVLAQRASCRVRALVEERGLRAATLLPGSQGRWPRRVSIGHPQDPEEGPQGPASVLGLLLDEAGPAAIASVVQRLADGALIDSRVLLAHRLGADESRWPRGEDRFASDLLLADRVRDPWLQQLTLGAGSGFPIALGGHSLVGPGAALALGLDG